LKNRGHAPGEGVVIAGKSVHAAIMKAGLASLIKVELIDTDESGKVDLNQLKAMVKKHGNKVIAIVGSAPSYPTGVIDPIEEMAKIAKDNGCGMHVDCCLGAFIINNLEQHKTSFLKIPGVTSLSADTHKNGLAPKGSSVLVTKKLDNQNLAYYSIYSIPGWSGGVYGTPKDAGSQSCVPSLSAFLAMLATGKEGYRRIAQAVHRTTCDLASIINEFPKQLRLIAQPEANVVAFKIDESWGLQKGASYAFADEMHKRNFILTAISNDIVHFCVTARFAGDPQILKQFKDAVRESLEATKKLNDELMQQGKKFSGEAGIYCALGAAIAPDRKVLSRQKYLENMLLGLKGAQDAVKAYFLAQLDPYANS
jgi:sphinganine-1-phosphate aldolase